MITRIVKLTFKAHFTKEFERKFPSIKPIVEGIDGCNSVILLKGSNNTFFTYSQWDSELELEAYRNSETFRDIWEYFKPNFSAPPEAWTTIQVG